jgi:glutamine synthetase
MSESCKCSLGEVQNIPEIFGSCVFSEEEMKTRLPKAVYKSWMKTKELGVPLDAVSADVIAAAMKEWACERGATHFTHWFFPMTGISAEKHDSFISPIGG